MTQLRDQRNGAGNETRTRDPNLGKNWGGLQATEYVGSSAATSSNSTGRNRLIGGLALVGRRSFGGALLLLTCTAHAEDPYYIQELKLIEGDHAGRTCVYDFNGRPYTLEMEEACPVTIKVDMRTMQPVPGDDSR